MINMAANAIQKWVNNLQIWCLKFFQINIRQTKMKKLVKTSKKQAYSSSSPKPQQNISISSNNATILPPLTRLKSISRKAINKNQKNSKSIGNCLADIKNMNSNKQKARLSLMKSKLSQLTKRMDRYKSSYLLQNLQLKLKQNFTPNSPSLLANRNKRNSVVQIQQKQIQNAINSVKLSSKKSKTSKQLNENDTKARNGHTRSKTKLQKKSNTQSVQEMNTYNMEKTEGKVKILFNHIHNRLKTVNTNEFKGKQHNDSFHSQSYSYFLASSQMMGSQNSKSVLGTPRCQIFEKKQKANKCVGSMIATINMEMEKLGQLESRNEDSMKMYMNQQIGLLNLEIYKNRLAQKRNS